MNYCCTNCFENEDIQKYIRSFRKIGTCDYCGEKNKYIVSTEDLGGFIRVALDNAYEQLGENTGSMYDSEEDRYIDQYGKKAGISIREILFDEEGIFNETNGTEELFFDLFKDSEISIKL